jgi:quercetin dioxygenase-like cupin family protein
MKIAMLCAAVLTLACAMVQAQTSGDNMLASSRAFPYEQMEVRTSPNGVERRSVATGTLATGETVQVRETMQPAGTPPSTLHTIQHTEVVVVEQGTLEFNHDGKVERVGPGGIIYVAFGTNHFVKNVGDGPAKYVVIQIGGDTKK